MDWTMPIIAAVTIAGYGWWLVNRLAMSREASDLYSSAILLLEQLRRDGQEAWNGSVRELDVHTELQIVSKLAAIEQRIELVSKYYDSRFPRANDFTGQILRLRRYLTIASDRLSENTLRDMEILRLTSAIISSLLDDSYSYVARGHKYSIRFGFVVLIALAIAVVLGQFFFSSPTPPTFNP